MFHYPRERDIVFLQSECLHGFSKLTSQPLGSCVDLFRKFGIFDYITDCFDYLHLSGVEYIIEDIERRIREGMKFAARPEA